MYIASDGFVLLGVAAVVSALRANRRRAANSTSIQFSQDE
jgi:hypothetical protein